MNKMFQRVGAVPTLSLMGLILLGSLLTFNACSGWIKNNGGLASWLQAVGSLYALAAVSLPVYLERGLSVQRARKTVLASAKMACELMQVVAERAFDPNAKFSEWWVPQWHVIEEVLASCPIHEIGSPEGLEAFVTLRELFGRLRSWDEQSNEGWPSGDGAMHSYVGNLCLNASTQFRLLEQAFD